ncbi:putative tail fiber protein [Escherichia phage vB_EcoD_Fulano1]|uniref:Tail fiber protein n=1 Tax=Escherichia phage vB_EcoD_Fulano1 TaxID=2902670 RepID=A0AC61TR87_9CAUD|nr:putative tail fiber protein [Escherichia phage vB_EcoD_Fulano1]
MALANAIICIDINMQHGRKRMAIYRTGQASMDAQGYITGYDTKWREQLTLIRPGATIVFLTQPLQIAVITEVINDTSIRAITTGGAVVTRSNYAILLHDSITVDGLAQDVAETLRYYQSKESEIGEALEFFKTFDWKHYQDLAKQVEENAASANQSKDAAARSASDALNSKNEAKASETKAKESENAANASKIAAKASETNAKNSEIAANTSKSEAARSASDALTSKNAAKASEDKAKEYADSINPENMLNKNNNLSDVADKGEARKNLSVDRLVQGTGASGETAVSSADGTKRIFVKNDGNWGVWDSTSQSDIALPISKGGTGSKSVESVRDNLNLMRQQRGVLSGNLNDLYGYSNFGYYYQGANANATPQNNYPVQKAGVLLVTSSTANGSEQANQYYYPIDDPSYYSRSYDKVSDSWRWSGWVWHPVASKYGVGQVKNLANDITNSGCQFISDNEGLTTWAATNGGGFQSSYDKYRIFQFWIDTAGNAYTRYNNTGDPKVAKTTTPWNTLQKSGTSDIRFKDVKGNLNVECALDNISRMNFKLFRYTFDSNERSARRGIIAQDAMMIDREYVHSDSVSGIMTLDINPLLMDGLAAIKALRARDVENKERISKLEKEVEELKAAVSALINKPTTLES